MKKVNWFYGNCGNVLLVIEKLEKQGFLSYGYLVRLELEFLKNSQEIR